MKFEDYLEDPDLRARIGELFQEMTKYRRDRLPSHRLNFSTQPPVFKAYPDKPLVDLPEPEQEGGTGIWDVIKSRRSHRQFSDHPLDLREISQLLWAAQGITFATRGFGFRAAPSAGALYPTETYLYARDVEGLKQGLYHYNIKQHALEELDVQDLSYPVARAALDQDMVLRAPLTVIWSAFMPRSKWKYLQRAYRYIYLDTAHVAENLMLAAEALGLGTCGIGAIYDDEVNQILGIDGHEETAIYLCVVGKLR